MCVLCSAGKSVFLPWHVLCHAKQTNPFIWQTVNRRKGERKRVKFENRKRQQEWIVVEWRGNQNWKPTERTKQSSQKKTSKHWDWVASITNYISKTKPAEHKHIHTESKKDEETYAKIHRTKESGSIRTKAAQNPIEQYTKLESEQMLHLFRMFADAVVFTFQLSYILIGSLQKLFPCQWRPTSLKRISQHHFGICSN